MHQALPLRYEVVVVFDCSLMQLVSTLVLAFLCGSGTRDLDR
jgi:hypothetical protein